MTLAVSSLPVLESGDRLTREEFHRRYEARPDLHRAELVDGVVYVPLPMRYAEHDRPAALCVGLLLIYAAPRPDVQNGANASLLIDDTTEVQPDAFLFRPDAGRLRLNGDGYLEGAPDLVIEVAASTASRDLHDKLHAYERAGVREYMVWRVIDEAIDYFVLEDGRFVRRDPDKDGVIESPLFPGLRFDTAKLLAFDRAGALAAIHPPR